MQCNEPCPLWNGLQLRMLTVPPGGGRELVLDYVMERKRMDDLAGSIVDGRFKEQKVAAAYLYKLNLVKLL